MEFRQIEQEDLPLLRDWRNQERIRKACREYKLLNMVNQEEWFERISISKQHDMFMIMDKIGKIPKFQRADWYKVSIGVCGLTNINWKDRHAEISYYSALEDALQNLNIAKEIYNFLKKKCFDEYGLNRLWGEIYSHNEVALKIALRNGLKIEGTMRQTNWWDGKWWDSIITAILAEEYYGIKTESV